MTLRLEQPRPVVRTAAGFHPHRARRQRGEQIVQPGPRHRRTHQHRLAVLIYPVHRKHVLGEIDADEYDSHGLPLPMVS